jgi:putative ABC transport system substrate-binding protein
MNRRKFIALIGGVVAMMPVAHSQAPPTIGFLSTTSPEASTILRRAFFRSLAQSGYIEGRNLAIEYRWAEGQYDLLAPMASDLVRRNVTIIAATGGLVSAKAAMASTSIIPILFIAGFDPVQERLVASINRPGGNATGVSVYTAELGQKRLQLLLELLPNVRSIAMLVNPGSTSTEKEIEDMERATRLLSVPLTVFRARNSAEIEKSFDEASRIGIGAILISADSFFTAQREQIVGFAVRYALPASYPWRQYVEIGGLMSYGTDLIWAYNQIGEYASRILAGTKPGDLPVIQPTKFELTINAKTAKALGLAVPPNFQALADSIFE